MNSVIAAYNVDETIPQASNALVNMVPLAIATAEQGACQPAKPTIRARSRWLPSDSLVRRSQGAGISAVSGEARTVVPSLLRPTVLRQTLHDAQRVPEVKLLQ